jgi:NAD(P)-dependent dehydrogenase (short-subunit alcohol dehydrogenase family)
MVYFSIKVRAKVNTISVLRNRKTQNISQQKIITPTKFPFITNEFSGKRILVTGGTAGMGKAIVSRLFDGVAKVITSAREMTSDHENREHIFVQADLSTSEGCTKVVNEVISRFGGVDILVNVVGGSSAPSGGFSVLSDEEWQKELSINLMATVRLDRGLLPGMLKKGSGVIIHLSSIQRRLPLFEATWLMRRQRQH